MFRFKEALCRVAIIFGVKNKERLVNASQIKQETKTNVRNVVAKIERSCATKSTRDAQGDQVIVRC